MMVLHTVALPVWDDDHQAAKKYHQVVQQRAFQKPGHSLCTIPSPSSNKIIVQLIAVVLTQATSTVQHFSLKLLQCLISQIEAEKDSEVRT